MLNPTAATPLYNQLMDIIEEDIISGVYKPGDRLQTEKEMSSNYNVSIITVRKAIGGLIEKGLVERKQGKGTFISRPKFSRNIKRLQSFSEMCYSIGATPGAKMLENKLVIADEKTAKKLNVPQGSKVIYIARLRFVNNEPVVIEKNYFPIKYAFLLDAKFNDNSLFDYLNSKSNFKVCSSEKTIELCHTNSTEAKLLMVSKNSNMLYVKSTAYDENNEPLYYGVQVINGHRFSLYVYEKI